MTRNVPNFALTSERVADLRRVRDRATRDASGALWELAPRRRGWFEDRHLVVVGKIPPRATPEVRRRAVAVTALGLRVLELWGQRVRTPHGSGIAIGIEFAPEPRVVVQSPRLTCRVPIESVMLDEQQEGARP